MHLVIRVLHKAGEHIRVQFYHFIIGDFGCYIQVDSQKKKKVP
jgi:hypothetical protein